MIKLCIVQSVAFRPLTTLPQIAMKSRLLVPSALLCLLPAAHAVVLVNDTFTDTDRIGGSTGSSTTTSSPSIGTPTSTNTQWIGTRVSQVVASGTGMLWTMDTASRVVTGYLPEVNLVAGTVTTFTLNFTTGAQGTGTTNNLRIALTDGTAAGARSTDGIGNTDATYVGDVGYAIFSGNNTGGTVPATDLTLNARERVTTSSNTLLGTAADWGANGVGNVSLGNSSGATGNFAGDSSYSMTFGFTYSGSSLDITTGVTGGNFSGMNFKVTDPSPATTKFNQLSFRLGGGSAQFSSINFTQFQVEQITPIPEPSSYAVLAGLGGLALAATRRRRA